MEANTLRSTYRELTPEDKEKVACVKEAGEIFLRVLDVVGNVNAGRELAIAKTKLEEAVMWATKFVTR